MSHRKLKPVRKLAMACALAGMSGMAGAADWLMLQGTEPESAAARAKVWGFVQFQYQKDTSDANAGGNYVPLKLIPPNLDSQSAFNVNRARIGVRGQGFPLDGKVNYFVLVEFGNNGITEPENSVAKVTDASITLNHIPNVRTRLGLFKYPGAEEGLQAIHVFDYVNFTQTTNQLLLERFPNRNYTANTGPQPIGADASAFERGVGAFRDVGIQFFDTFKLQNNWEASYAFMVGNGNGLNFSDNNDDKDKYLYLALSKVKGGKGPFRNDMKFFVWKHDGVRTADLTNDATFNPVDYDRERYGAGFKIVRDRWHASAEYVKADGMIWQGPHNESFGIGPGQGNPGANGSGAFAEAKGWYVEGGYKIPNSKFEVDLRYDELNRLDGNLFQVNYETWTVGLQYHFNRKTRAILNYEMRDANAPNFAAGAGPNANLDGVDDRIAFQITHIF